ncbi:MAG: AbrB/MazE/SpoVT family DNA-binding domain-containing protein [Thermoanaerobacteraceae bacterium]|nr:AbrB/MazE/SpoVT family DNA-binding domain-containing protein [Thermoanaerobacteraceae bacterium]
MASHIAITKLSSRGQIVIPKEIRELLAWEAGDHVAVEVQGDKVVLRRLVLDSFLGEGAVEDERVGKVKVEGRNIS